MFGTKSRGQHAASPGGRNHFDLASLLRRAVEESRRSRRSFVLSDPKYTTTSDPCDSEPSTNDPSECNQSPNIDLSESDQSSIDLSDHSTSDSDQSSNDFYDADVTITESCDGDSSINDTCISDNSTTATIPPGVTITTDATTTAGPTTTPPGATTTLGVMIMPDARTTSGTKTTPGATTKFGKTTTPCATTPAAVATTTPGATTTRDASATLNTTTTRSKSTTPRTATTLRAKTTRSATTTPVVTITRGATTTAGAHFVSLPESEAATPTSLFAMPGVIQKLFNMSTTLKPTTRAEDLKYDLNASTSLNPRISEGKVGQKSTVKITQTAYTSTAATTQTAIHVSTVTQAAYSESLRENGSPRTTTPAPSALWGSGVLLNRVGKAHKWLNKTLYKLLSTTVKSEWYDLDEHRAPLRVAVNKELDSE